MASVGGRVAPAAGAPAVVDGAGVAAIGVAPVPLLGAAGLDVAVVPHAAAAMLRTASKLRTLVVPRCIPFLTSPWETSLARGLR